MQKCCIFCSYTCLWPNKLILTKDALAQWDDTGEMLKSKVVTCLDTGSQFNDDCTSKLVRFIINLYYFMFKSAGLAFLHS